MKRPDLAIVAEWPKNIALAPPMEAGGTAPQFMGRTSR
jgi:hypothetical protein